MALEKLGGWENSCAYDGPRHRRRSGKLMMMMMMTILMIIEPNHLS